MMASQPMSFMRVVVTRTPTQVVATRTPMRVVETHIPM